MRIINDHDGLIKVDSVLGEGTTVSLWFKEQQEHVEVVKAEQLFELSEDDFEPDLSPLQNPTT